MLRAARQDGETVQQQLHGEILELKLTCRRLEERLSASDREQDRLHQENMRLLTDNALSQPSSPLPTKRADTAAAAAKKDSTEKEEEPSPEAAAAPSLPTQHADTAAAAPEDGTAKKDSTDIEEEPSREEPSPQAPTAPSLGLAPLSRLSPPILPSVPRLSPQPSLTSTMGNQHQHWHGHREWQQLWPKTDCMLKKQVIRLWMSRSSHTPLAGVLETEPRHKTSVA